MSVTGTHIYLQSRKHFRAISRYFAGRVSRTFALAQSSPKIQKQLMVHEVGRESVESCHYVASPIQAFSVRNKSARSRSRGATRRPVQQN